MKQVYKDTEKQALNERVARLEVGMISVCDSINEIKTNHLVHINDKIDKLDERFDILDKKVEGMAVKIGIIFAVATTLGQAVISYFLK